MVNLSRTLKSLAVEHSVAVVVSKPNSEVTILINFYGTKLAPCQGFTSCQVCSGCIIFVFLTHFGLYPTDY